MFGLSKDVADDPLYKESENISSASFKVKGGFIHDYSGKHS